MSRVGTPANPVCMPSGLTVYDCVACELCDCFENWRQCDHGEGGECTEAGCPGFVILLSQWTEPRGIPAPRA